MPSDDNKVKYSDSPFAPDWAKAPEKRGDVITSFGKPIPEAEDNPHLDFGNQENSASKAKTDEDASQPFKPTVEQIEEILWQDANDDINVYCIMDGYWAEGLYGRLLTSDDISWAHMFQGDVATRNIQQAPFIIALKRGHKLTKWLIEEGWGQGWGIYFTASTHKAHLLYGNPRINDKRFLPSNEEQLKLGNLTKGPEDTLWKMRRHFRQFSDVYLESENKIVDFRYYDPWVMNTWIEADKDDILHLPSGPILSFIYENNTFISKLNPMKYNSIIIKKVVNIQKNKHKNKHMPYYNIDIFIDNYFSNSMNENTNENSKFIVHSYFKKNGIAYNYKDIDKYFEIIKIKSILYTENCYVRSCFFISTILFGLEYTSSLYEEYKDMPNGISIFSKSIEDKILNIKDGK